jgi:NlpC/P60 family
VTIADGLGGWIQTEALGEPLEKDRAHVVVVPQAADRYLGTWLVAPGLRTEPLAAARRKAGGDAIAETALMFLGAPYEWGGVTVHGLDCSGLVQAVHRRFGLLLPHNAEQQESAGREVSLRQAQPGDLICYGDHIAIWVGEGRIVHAAKEAGKVVEEPHPAELKSRVRTVRRLYEPED